MLFLMMIFILALTQTNEATTSHHQLDETSMRMLYKRIRPPHMENPMPFCTTNRTQHECWELANRIKNSKTYTDIFTEAEQNNFDILTSMILQSHSYQLIFNRAREGKVSWDRFVRVGAIIAKNKLVKLNITYPSNYAQPPFEEFVNANHEDDSKYTYEWMITDTMFWCYLHQIARNYKTH